MMSNTYLVISSVIVFSILIVYIVYGSIQQTMGQIMLPPPIVGRGHATTGGNVEGGHEQCGMPCEIVGNPAASSDAFKCFVNPYQSDCANVLASIKNLKAQSAHVGLAPPAINMTG